MVVVKAEGEWVDEIITMDPVIFDRIWPFFVACSCLAGLSFLRVFSIVRYRQISTHDVACKAAAMRRAYAEAQQKEHEAAEESIEV